MNKKRNIGLEIVRRTAGTIFIPAMIYIVFFIAARKSGLTYFGNANTWRNIILDTGAAASIAFALATQIKNGRFDFSGGAIMTLGALVSLYLAVNVYHNGFFYLFISILLCAVMSVLAALVYVKGRIPVVICTVGAAIFFESLTLIFNGGQTVSISNDPVLNFPGRKAAPLMILIFISASIYFVYSTFTISGRRGQLLAGNQEAAVHIGIDENRNVIQSFLVSGILYGIASVIYASQAFQVEVVPSVLGTVSIAFTSLLPVFMGFFIGSFSNDAIGILFSSLAVGILKYGIEVLAPTGYAGAFKNAVMGLFMIVFFLASRKGRKALIWLTARIKEGKVGSAST